MKHILSILLLLLANALYATIYVGHVTHEEGYGKEYHDCAYDVPSTYPTKTVYLYGKVKVVTQREKADLAVYVTSDDQQYDMCVQWVQKNPDECGLWQQVDKGEDFSIMFVESYKDADLVIFYDDPRKHYNYNGHTYYPFMTF